MGELRERKKRETKQRISDLATELFFARGFDAVTVDEVAAAADVSKVTVFNYFPRKEDLFLDRQGDVGTLFDEAFRSKREGQSAVDALRRLVDKMCDEGHPFARIDRQTVGFWRVVAASPSLKARVREIGDEAVDGLATALAGPKPDGHARLIAGMIVLTWRTAYAEAVRVFERARSAKKATAAFLALIDSGFAAVRRLEAKTRRP